MATEKAAKLAQPKQMPLGPVLYANVPPAKHPAIALLYMSCRPRIWAGAGPMMINLTAHPGHARKYGTARQILSATKVSPSPPRTLPH